MSGFESELNFATTKMFYRLIKTAGSVIGVKMDSLGEVVERYTMKMMEAILNKMDHLLHNTLMDQRSSGGGRLLFLHCRTERYRRSFIPTAIRLFNSSANGR